MIDIPIEFQNYIPEPNTGCWLWLGELMYDNKYPAVSIPRKQLAHRALYRFLHPEVSMYKKLLHHTCKTKLCICPDHLQLLDGQGEHNKLHAKDKKAIRTITPEIEQALIESYNDLGVVTKAAFDIGISQSAACKVLHRLGIDTPNIRKQKRSLKS